MTGGICALLIAMLFAACASAPDPEHDESSRDTRRIVFEGVEAFDVAQVQKQLSLNIDVQTAAHPRKSLTEFVETIERTVDAGYRHSGFPEATVEAAFDEQSGRIVVHVREGIRYRCGAVRVQGLPAMLEAELTEALTEKFCPLGVVPVVKRQVDGTGKTEWQTTTGEPSGLSSPVWKSGEPARIDAFGSRPLRSQIRDFFLAQGFSSPNWKLTYELDSKLQSITAVITVKDLGRHSIVDEITVVGDDRHSTEEILDYLDLKMGMPFTGRLRDKLERQLWESGRYIESGVDPIHPKFADVPVEVTLVEHPYAPRLTEEPTTENRALSKLLDWLTNWSAGEFEEDLILEASCNGAELLGLIGERVRVKGENLDEVDPATNYLFNFRIVASPRLGHLISVRATTRNGNTVLEQSVLADETRLVLMSPLNRSFLEFPHLSRIQLLPELKFSAAKPNAKDTRGLKLTFGATGTGRNPKFSGPLAICVKASPAAVLAASHCFKQSATRRENGCLQLATERLRIVIDEQTGRLEGFELHGENGETKLRIRSANDALSGEKKGQLDQMAGWRNLYDPNHLWKSFAFFLLDEYRPVPGVRHSEGAEQSLAALYKLIDHWSGESFSDLSSVIADDDESPDRFRIPDKRVVWTIPEFKIFNQFETGSVVGWMLAIYREFVPRAGCLWPVGRDALLSLISRLPGSPYSVCAYDEVASSGPVGHLIAALMLQPSSPATTKRLADDGLEKLSIQDFRADYTPFLAADSWIGRNIVSLAEAMGKLDATEIDALVRLLPIENNEPAVADALHLLRRKRNGNVRDTLPGVLDRLWTVSLKSSVENALRSLAAGESFLSFDKDKTENLDSKFFPDAEEKRSDVSDDRSRQKFPFRIK